MKKILLCLALLVIAGTASAVSFYDVYDALLLDAELSLDGKSDISLDSLTTVTNKIDTLKHQVLSREISEDEAVLMVIDIYGSKEGLHCKNLAQAIDEYNNHQVAKSDSLLLAQCNTLECKINEAKSYGWTVPNRTQAKYNSLIIVRNSNARLFEQERTRRLTTVGYYVTEYENGAYLKIQMKDEQYGIKAEFPSPDNPMDPRPAVISSGFYALDGIRQGQFHTGIDIPKCEYCSTVAFASGFAKPLSDENRKNIAGKYVELDCPQLSMRFKYAHLSKHKIHWPGKYVEAGDIIGLEGRTGRTTGPNLHFEAILVIDNQEYKLNGKHLFSNFAERIVKDVIYIKKTTGGYKIIPEEEFKEAIESLALER